MAADLRFMGERLKETHFKSFTQHELAKQKMRNYTLTVELSGNSEKAPSRAGIIAAITLLLNDKLPTGDTVSGDVTVDSAEISGHGNLTGKITLTFENSEGE